MQDFFAECLKSFIERAQEVWKVEKVWDGAEART